MMQNKIIYNIDRDVFWRVGFEVAERILGLGDRRKGSITSGCYDRLFWKYKLIDYPSSWFQSAVEYLALLWDIQNSPFYKSEKVRDWCIDAHNFSLSNLNKDGSCIEVYPFERSFCATAFVLGHICAAHLIIPKPKNINNLIKMGIFLKNNWGGYLSNQLAAAALAQFRLSKVLSEKDFQEDGYKKLEALYDNQTVDGYFEEYGGLDIGYLSITLSLLARLENEFPNVVDRDRIQRALIAFEDRVKDEGTYDYSAMSRETQFLYPFGLFFWGSPVIKRLENGLKNGVIIRPSWLDDRYVTELAIDYLYLLKWLQRER